MTPAIPGLIVATLVWFAVREPANAVDGSIPAPVAFGELFRHRNVVLAMLGLVCAMTGIDVLGAMLPSYFTEFMKFTPQRMGFVMSAIGVGAIFGQFAFPAISDLIGRRDSARGRRLYRGSVRIAIHAVVCHVGRRSRHRRIAVLSRDGVAKVRRMNHRAAITRTHPGSEHRIRSTAK